MYFLQLGEYAQDVARKFGWRRDWDGVEIHQVRVKPTVTEGGYIRVAFIPSTLSREYGLYSRMGEIITRVRALPGAVLFARPVVPSEWGIADRDYFSVVPDPMDLQTIQQRVWAAFYMDMAAFRADVMLMFDNTMVFNAETTHAHRVALGARNFVTRQFPLEFPASQTYAVYRQGDGEAQVYGDSLVPDCGVRHLGRCVETSPAGRVADICS